MSTSSTLTACTSRCGAHISPHPRSPTRWLRCACASKSPAPQPAAAWRSPLASSTPPARWLPSSLPHISLMVRPIRSISWSTTPSCGAPSPLPSIPLAPPCVSMALRSTATTPASASAPCSISPTRASSSTTAHTSSTACATTTTSVPWARLSTARLSATNSLCSRIWASMPCALLTTCRLPNW